MKSVNINCKLYINKVKDFKKHKEKLLKLIDDMPPVMAEFVTKSDWLVQKQFARPYLDYFYSDVAHNVMNTLAKKFKAVNWNIGNGWYQQYKKGSYHKWHNHTQTNYTNVFFLELPDND